MVYGLPSSKQDRLQSLLSSFGSLTQFHPGPSDSNYVVVAFDDPAAGLRLERQSGELRLDGCYLGIKRVGSGLVPDAWMQQGGQAVGESMGNQQKERTVTSHGGRNNNDPSSSSSSSSMATATMMTTSNSHSTPTDPFANISTLTPVKSGTGSVFRPQVLSSSVSQPVIPAGYSFGTVSGQQQQQHQQQQQQQQARLGLFGRLSDVMVSDSSSVVVATSSCWADAGWYDVPSGLAISLVNKIRDDGSWRSTRKAESDTMGWLVNSSLDGSVTFLPVFFSSFTIWIPWFEVHGLGFRAF
jgi:hypothetical protein